MFSAIICDTDVLDGTSDVLCLWRSKISLIMIWSSWVLTRTPSHICGRLYLCMFLLRVWLFTHVYIDSLIVLAKICPSLPTMLRLPNVMRWPVVDRCPYIGEGAFVCSLNLSPNVLVDSPMYSAFWSSLLHLYQYIIALFVVFGLYSFVLPGCSWVFCCF